MRAVRSSSVQVQRLPDEVQVIAVAIGLVALSAALTAAVITCGVWLRGETNEGKRLRDTLESTRVRADLAEHDAATLRKRLEVEQNLRAIAEAQRNEAQRKTRDLLRKHLETATDDEIRALTADAFSGLSSVPRSEDGDRSLLRPGDEL